MSAVVWANVLLALPFLAAFIAVPLWLTFRRPQNAPDHAHAHSCLPAKQAHAVRPDGPASDERSPEAAFAA